MPDFTGEWRKIRDKYVFYFSKNSGLPVNKKAARQLADSPGKPVF
jgi:hypothetical protein